MEKRYITELVKQWTEDNIDISEQYNKWITFLKKNGYLMSYKEVYEMDLDYLISNKDTEYWNEDKQEWDVELLIKNDNDIEKINDNLFFVHQQEYIDNDIINDFYKEQNLNWAINQAYIDLDQSSDGFSRFDALLFIFGHDFGEQKIFFASDIDKVKKELLKCFQEVLIERNKLEERKESKDSNFAPLYLDLWLPNHSIYSNEEDEHYCELIRFGGYQILEDGHQILKSDAILLINDDGIYTLDYFTYENMHHLCDYIAEVFESYKTDCLDVDGEAYKQETNKKLNAIIDKYWKYGKIDFDYAEFLQQ